MKNINWIFLLAGILPIENGLRYFVGGDAYRNSDLRSYAVVGQIVFGLLIIAYGFWHRKTSLETGKA